MKTVRIEIDDSGILTSRETGLSLRVAIEAVLQNTPAGEQITLDFSSISNATHSCLDEMIGVLVLDRGLHILDRLVFVNCPPAVRSLLQFVVADRLEAGQPTR